MSKSAPIPSQASSPTLTDWRPEDTNFWADTGSRVANRNLFISIPALLLAFAVWMMFSAVSVKLKDIGSGVEKEVSFERMVVMLKDKRIK